MKYFFLALLALPAFAQFGAASRVLSGNGNPVAAQCTNQNNVGLVWAQRDGNAAGSTFYVCGATGVGTFGWELRGGSTGGSGALTTVGSVPFVTAAGILGQSANLSFDSANNRLVLGVGTVIRSSTDTSLSRSAAGVWQAGDGGTNANGSFLATIHTWANGVEATCSPSTRGQVVMVQGGVGVADTMRVCRKDALDVYAWTALY